MKKALLAAFAAAATIPCAAADEDPVTMYGRIYVMFDRVEAKGGAAADLGKRNRVTDQASLLGFRGTERLGGGLKAIWQLETAFQPEQNNGTFARRNSGVGLEHRTLGTLIMGRWDMPFKSAMASPLDPFTDLALADITGTALNQGNYATRAENVVQWWSPDWKGLEVRLAYVANEAKTAARDPYMYGGSVVWSNKQVYLAYAYEKHKAYSDGTITTGVDEEGNGLGAYVRVGTAKIMAQYGEYKRTGTRTQKSYSLGLDWVFGGVHHLLAIYQNSKNGGATTLATQPRCDMYGIGYRYDFSRRTFFTAYYTMVDNEVGNLCNFGAATLGISAGQDPQGWSAGLRHTF